MINKILMLIYPDANNLEIISAHSETETIGGLSAIVEKIIDSCFHGNPRPIVIYGFDSFYKINKSEEGFIFQFPGVFYLKLPTCLSEIKKVLQNAASFKMPPVLRIDHKIFQKLMVQKIRAFKHTCDNLWMSFSSNANRAKNALNISPDETPRALSEFIPSRIDKLLKDYKELEPSAIRIGIKDADRVSAMIQEAVKMIDQIQADHMSPQEAVDLAFGCTAEIKAVSKILSGAKETKNSV